MANSETTFPPIIVITGPTAVGKSALALELAPRFGAEIASADSRQVYRYLDIGTAKPTAEEQRAVRHHLIDLVDPDEPYSVADFQRDANRVLVDIKQRGRVVFLVGGSPHYIQALVDRLDIPRVPPQAEFRAEMESFARQHGPESLHQRLMDVDPSTADAVPASNVRRVIRALEVHHFTGRPFSEIGRRRGTPMPTLRIGVTTERGTLYRRIDDRVHQQLRDGLIDEARRVLEMGFDPSLPPLAGFVYREAIALVQGNMSLADATRRMQETNHAFARRQYTWFRRDPGIQWFELGPQLVTHAAAAIEQYIESYQLPAVSLQLSG